ncbi:MAG: BrnA antitoxin family protein [Treponema sp.]|nr:BrnA antitoxin family protein [Treponema sp.]
MTRKTVNTADKKKMVNVHIDANILEWLQSGGSGYQTRMNAILREAMPKVLRVPEGTVL